MSYILLLNNIDPQLSSVSFEAAFNTLREQTEIFQQNKLTDTKEVELILVSIQIFIALCYTFLSNKELSNHDRETVLEYRRLSYTLQSKIYDLLNKNFTFAWSSAPLFRLANKDQAQKLVDEGYATTLDEIFVELKPEPEKTRKNLQTKWHDEGRYTSPLFAWSDAPLPTSLRTD